MAIKTPEVPSYKFFIEPAFAALKSLGGSGSIDEIDSKAASFSKLSDALLEIPHKEKSGRAHGTEVEYRLHWARSYLKLAGYITNSQRGVWSLTELGASTEQVNAEDVIAAAKRAKPENGNTIVEPTDVSEPWRIDLIDVLQQMDPKAFERLAQRLLRESGFVEVEVTGKSGDGGIDGYGTLKLNEMLSVQALFQCKRYASPVPPKDVREFCGAMTKRQKQFGIFLATNTFTRKAQEEAQGPLSIKLVDIDKLLDLLKELRLGVVASHQVDRSFFASI